MMDEPSDYLYDIFLSYPHEEPHRTWVHDFFLEPFKSFVNENLPPRVKVEIYVDVKMNKIGDEWWPKVKTALARSKVFIPIWSMAYFRSRWCRAECAIMYHRHQQLGFGNHHSPQRLILPIRLFDSAHYPSFTSDILHLDCSDVNLVFEGYKNTPQYFELLKLLKGWAPDVAGSILSAPAWDKAWLSKPWLDDAIDAAENGGLFATPNRPFTPPKM